MSRIKTTFTALSVQNRKALIPYITAGDPDPKLTVQIMQTMVSAGADILELGVPFSDPMAEGPVIEAAHHRALACGVNLTKVLAIVAEFRQQDSVTPIVLMGYVNPFIKMGYQTFAHQAKKAGVDGVLIVDLPPEEADEWLEALHGQQLDTIFLCAPTTSHERMQLIAQKASGYLYYVSLKGVTGSQILNIEAIAQRVAELRQYSQLPVAVGFGIRDATTAAQVAKIADAVIVGSAIVAKIAALTENSAALLQEVSTFTHDLHMAVKRGNT